MLEELMAQRIDGVAIGRTRSPAPRNIPLALRSATRQRVTRGRFAPTSRRILLIKWVIDGEAAMAVEGRRLKFRPGDVAVHIPSIAHQFWALSDTCEMCWFSVDGPVAEEFVLAMGLQPGVFTFGDPPVDRIEEMIQSLKDYTVQGQRHASLLAIHMLYQVADRIYSATEVPSVVRQAQQMIHAEFGDPDLSVDSISARLHYHRGSMSRVFHKHTGVT